MANIEHCLGFETFGTDVKAAQQAKHISRNQFDFPACARFLRLVFRIALSLAAFAGGAGAGL